MTAGSLPAQSAQPNTTWALFERYARGEHAAVAAELTRTKDFDALRKDLDSVAVARWLQAAGPAAVAGRRLVLATFALEAAQASLAPNWHPGGRQLIEWGKALLKDTPTPLPAERDWWLASVAVADRASGDAGLQEFNATTTGRSPVRQMRRFGPWGRLPFDHLRDASSRFPDEPRFRFAVAFADELPLENEPPRDRAWRTMDALVGESNGPGGLAFVANSEIARREAIGHSIKEYERFLSDAEMSAEAHLRIGTLLMRLHEYTAALVHLRQVEPLTREPFLVYLARFFAGQIAEETSRNDLAEGAYRAALDAVPRAESGAERLAALLIARNQPNDAYRLIDEALSATPLVEDPWRVYSLGDARLWPTFIARLRANLIK